MYSQLLFIAWRLSFHPQLDDALCYGEKGLNQQFRMEKFSLKKLNYVEGKEKYRVGVWNRFAVLEDLDAEVETNSAWETIRENIKISANESVGYYELKNSGYSWN
jgi:hypothetical protein